MGLTDATGLGGLLMTLAWGSVFITSDRMTI